MARLDRPTCEARLAAARVGHLATVTSAGLPHVVPCCFILEVAESPAGAESPASAESPAGSSPARLYSVVDGKPKSTAALKRLDNIASTPAASLVADHYDDDWTKLWWVRADGPATVVDPETAAEEREAALEMLADKYQQYRADPPQGALLRIDVTHLTGWAFTDG